MLPSMMPAELETSITADMLVARQTVIDNIDTSVVQKLEIATAKSERARRFGAS
jgi:hypothetical protein